MVDPGTASGSTGLTALTDYINSLNRTGQTAANQARIPGSAGLEEQSSANIQNELAGNVNPDVIRLLQQQGAERGIRVGSDSPNANASYLQALGLTSTALQQQGQKDLSAADARNPGAPLFDPSTQLLTPYQAGTLDLEQGRLNLASTTEANRTALEQQRINAQNEALQSASANRAATASAAASRSSAPYTGLTGGSLFGGSTPNFGTPNWWSSIGYGSAGSGWTNGTGTGGTYMGTQSGFDQSQRTGYDQLLGTGAYDTDFGIGTLTSDMGLSTDSSLSDSALYEALANLGGEG